jgi:hypothetical protein
MHEAHKKKVNLKQACEANAQGSYKKTTLFFKTKSDSTSSDLVLTTREVVRKLSLSFFI